MKFNGSFGAWLKQRRRVLDLTQADLADQVGCSITTIRKIESDTRRPSKQISQRMADVLAVALEDHAAFVGFARRVTNSEAPLVDDLAVLIPGGNLPSQSTPFIGRENELAQIADADVGLRPVASFHEVGNGDRGQQPDEGDDDHDFHESESRFTRGFDFHTPLLSLSWRERGNWRLI